MLIIILILAIVSGQEAKRTPVEIDNIPIQISECLSRQTSFLVIDRRMNPYYLRADFNGDSRTDYVVLVQDNMTNKRGFAFCLGGPKPVLHVIGAGKLFALESGVERDNLGSFDVWGIADRKSMGTKHDALYLERAESGSGLVYWQRGRFAWKQLAF